MQAMSSVGKQLMSQSLSKYEALGGVVSGTEESRGKISLDRPNRQWDYPLVFSCLVICSTRLTYLFRSYAWFVSKRYTYIPTH